MIVVRRTTGCGLCHQLRSSKNYERSEVAPAKPARDPHFRSWSAAALRDPQAGDGCASIAKKFSVTSESGEEDVDAIAVLDGARPTHRASATSEARARRCPKLTLIAGKHQRRRVEFLASAAPTRSRSARATARSATRIVGGRGIPPNHGAPRRCSAAKKEKR